MSALRTPRWSPLLDGAAAAEALGVVRQIAEELRVADRLAATTPPGTATARDDGAADRAARASFYAACDDAFPGAGFDEAADELLAAAVDRAQDEGLPAALHGGILAVAVALDELAYDDGHDPCGEIDEALLDELGVETWPGEYDLISGLVGIGVYGLRRGARGAGTTIAARALEHLEARATATAAGLSWRTPPEHLPPYQRAATPGGYLNAGVAHGVPGVVGLAARALRAGVARDRAERLARGAIGWLESIEIAGADARFPRWIADDGPTTPARTAWCYGDPGVAVQLWAAGDALDDPRLRREAVALGRLAIARAPERAAIREPGLCHGAVGLAHILNRLAQASGDAALRDAAVDWYRRALQMRVPGRGIAGFLALAPDPDGGGDVGRADRSLLRGATGIGRALLAASTAAAPVWDDVLLLGL